MRSIAFITATAVVRDILLALGQPIAPPASAPPRPAAVGRIGRCRQPRRGE